MRSPTDHQSGQMPVSVTPDPAHPTGGHALIGLPGKAGSTVHLTIRNPISERYLALDGWQSEPVRLGPFTVRPDEKLSLGPVLVQHLCEYMPLELAVFAPDPGQSTGRHSITWPDTVRPPPSPERGRGGLAMPTKPKPVEGTVPANAIKATGPKTEVLVAIKPSVVRPPALPEAEPVPQNGGRKLLLFLAVLTGAAILAVQWFWGQLNLDPAPDVALLESIEQPSSPEVDPEADKPQVENAWLSPAPPEQPTAPEPDSDPIRPAFFSGSNTELIQALQKELNLHQCNPGPVDGSFGPRSSRGLRLFNLVAPESCGRLLNLEPILRRDPDASWRESAVQDLDVLQQCAAHAPACGTPPGKNFYREMTKGCWYEAYDVDLNEYGTWSGECDTEGYVAGRGTMEYHYPTKVAGTFIKTFTGPMERGVKGTGPFHIVGMDGSETRGEYRAGVLHGPWFEKGPALTQEGQYKNGKKEGAWTMRETSGYSHRIVYDNGRAVRGAFKDENGNSYDGELNGSLDPHGQGTHTQEDGTTASGIFRNGNLHGQIMISAISADGSRYTYCSIYENGVYIRLC